MFSLPGCPRIHLITAKSGSNWWDPWEATTLTTLPLQSDDFLWCTVPSSQHHNPDWPGLLTPMLLWQASQHPSNCCLDFIFLPSRPHGSFQTVQRSGLSQCSASLFIPTSTTAQEFFPRMPFFFCLFFRCRSLLLGPTLASFPVGGQYNDQ